MPSAPRGALAITLSVDSLDDGALPVEVAVEAAGVAAAVAVDAAAVVTAATSPVSGAGLGVQTTKLPLA